MLFRSGDVVLTCTDGITEAANVAGDQYESERMVTVAQRERAKPTQQIVDSIIADVDAFSLGGEHTDDRVLMAIKVKEKS